MGSRVKDADDLHDLRRRVAALETELSAERRKHQPAKDAWHDDVVAYLNEPPIAYRIASFILLVEVVGLEPEAVDSDAYRRLARIMRAIGWIKCVISDPEDGIQRGWKRG